MLAPMLLPMSQFWPTSGLQRATMQSLSDAEGSRGQHRPPRPSDRPGGMATNRWEVDDVPIIASLLLPPLRLLWPPVGRYRAPETRRVPPVPSPPRVPPLSGETIGLVRPYLVAHERRQAAEASP